jgi:hypothetical protein
MTGFLMNLPIATDWSLPVTETLHDFPVPRNEARDLFLGQNVAPLGALARPEEPRRFRWSFGEAKTGLLAAKGGKAGILDRGFKFRFGYRSTDKPQHLSKRFLRTLQHIFVA